MNYRHAYHAGNVADIVKHAVLCFILAYMKAKDAPFFVLDTHAGLGTYDLTAVEPNKTGEWVKGIARLWNERPDGPVGELLAPYLACLEKLNPDGELRTYPGSPELIRQGIRSHDRALFCELHPDDGATLARRMGGYHNVKIEKADGWASLGHNLPPKERRGVVLIDPPYEERNEYVRLSGALKEGLKRFATGTYILWYPVKGPDDIRGLTRAVAALGVPKTLKLELHTRKPNNPGRFDGCGLIVVNPPWTLAPLMERALPLLAEQFSEGPGHAGIVEWLGEQPA